MDSRDRTRTLIAALGLVLAVLALYWPVRAHDFVAYDDELYLVRNPHLAQGLDWTEARWLVTHAYGANYHPLTWLAHMLDVELFGLAPGPHHLVNVALHALNAVLVLLLARALLGNLAAATLAAALFALHPLRVESVAWASERKDLLCAFFYLSALLAWLRYGRAPSLGRYAFVLVLTLLALLAKPMAVTLPGAFLLLDLWPLGRLDVARPWRPARPGGGARLVLEKLPFFALAALGALSTWMAQESGGAASTTLAVPLELRAWNALVSCGTYLLQSFWPARLAVFYPLAALVEEEPRAALLAPALASALVLAVAGVAAWRLRQRAPWFLVGFLWFLGLLVPVLGLKQVGQQAHADRYTYLPLLGVAWIVSGAGFALARRSRPLRSGLAGLALVALALLAWKTRAQLATWRDTPSLYQHALAVRAKNFVAHAGLGDHYLEHGEEARAREHLEAALALYPLEPTALLGLARLELGAGNALAAEQHLQLAKQTSPSPWVRYHMGRTKLALGNPEAALREFGAALELDPTLIDAHFHMGLALFGLGRKDEARSAFERALALAPHAGAENGLGVLALDAGDASAAEQRFLRAVALDPAYADALHNLGLALERQGRADEARARFAEAQRLAPAAARKP